MRACQRFTVAEGRLDPLDCGADRLRQAQVEDKTIKSVLERAQESDTSVFYDVMLERVKEPIAAGQKTSDEHLPLNVVQYEIKHFAYTRNNNVDGLSREQGS